MLHKIGIMSALILGLAMPAAAECLIQKDSIGGIKLGQNLKQVKQKFPKAKMERESPKVWRMLPLHCLKTSWLSPIKMETTILMRL